jgi:hypothetical protein
VSRQAKVNIVGTIIAALGLAVLWIAYARGGLIMVYVLPFILALCGLAFWNHRKWKAEKRATPSH